MQSKPAIAAKIDDLTLPYFVLKGSDYVLPVKDLLHYRPQLAPLQRIYTVAELVEIYKFVLALKDSQGNTLYTEEEVDCAFYPKGYAIYREQLYQKLIEIKDLTPHQANAMLFRHGLKALEEEFKCRLQEKLNFSNPATSVPIVVTFNMSSTSLWQEDFKPTITKKS